MSNRKAVPTAQQAQSEPDESAKVTALHHAITTGLKNLEHGRFTEVQDANLERYISELGMHISET
ncbi:hypothetical protein [Pseudomonas sp. TMW22080]|uniref:hypothetical protein n=1 Tax=Pseudomonas sp. TMW22080 TaxID=2506432 RepID=UPI001F101F69|nr:hypothetical protein [Pseudomonas sp. TMW22080]MCH4883203.1 hypothetical protein [Pseudomonas sp. TMW22080]